MQREWQPTPLSPKSNQTADTGAAYMPATEEDDFSSRKTPVMNLQELSLIVPNMYAGSKLLGKIYVGSMADGADALCRGNPLDVQAVINCAQEDWMHHVRKGRLDAPCQKASDFTGELRNAFDELSEAPEGFAKRGTVMGISYLGFNAKDRASANLSDSPEKEIGDYLAASLAFIVEHLGRGHTILVHCLRGENRSAAVCAAFLIQERGMSPEEAVAFLREKRGDAALSNQGFVEELRALGNTRTLAPIIGADPVMTAPLPKNQATKNAQRKDCSKCCVLQ